MLYGVSIKQSMLEDEKLLDILPQHFNCYYAEKALKMNHICFDPTRYDFDLIDKIVNLAVQHKAKIRGHALMWRLGVPEWLESSKYSQEQIWSIVTDYLAATISRYEGRIEFWDVVNEAIGEDGKVLNSFWTRKLG